MRANLSLPAPSKKRNLLTRMKSTEGTIMQKQNAFTSSASDHESATAAKRP